MHFNFQLNICYTLMDFALFTTSLLLFVWFLGKDITLPCGRTTYDPLWNTCCCGKVHPGAVDRHTGCCLTRRYNLDKQLCCDGRVINLDPELYHCCGKQAYDPWNQTCCHGYFVVNGKGTCCGYFKIFDHKHQICCAEKYVFDGHPCRTKCCYAKYFGVSSTNCSFQSTSKIKTHLLLAL